MFPDMLTETEKIESYIQENYGGHIRAAYSCSLGGSFVGLMVQRKNIHIDHAILGSSDLVTPMEESISIPGTTVHCFYAAKMGEEYLHRYQKHFADPVIHQFDMEHEELLVLFPEQWAEKVRDVCV